MKKVSQLSLFAVCFTTTTSTTLVLGMNDFAGSDSYLAALCGMLLALPLYAMAAALRRRFPDKRADEVVLLLFGRVFGRILLGIYALFSLLTGAILISYVTRFLLIVGRTSALAIVFSLLITLATALTAKSGLAATARLCRLLFPLAAGVLLLSLLLSFSRFDPAQLLPLLNRPFGDFALGSLSLFFYPFAQALFCMPFLFRCEAKGVEKPLLASLFCSGAVTALCYALTAGVLGEGCLYALSYPYYMALSVLEINSFFQRIEVILSVHFIVGMYLKTCVCLLFCLHSLGGCARVERPERLAPPMAALMLGFSLILFADSAELLAALRAYPFLAAPFLVIPLFAAWLLSFQACKRARNPL